MKTTSITVVALGILLQTSIAAACWDVRERSKIEGFSEMEGTLVLSFKDAVDCKPVSNADVTVMGKQYTSDKRGYVELPMEPFSVMEAKIPVVVRKKGYSTLKTNIEVEAGTVIDRRFALSRSIPPGKLRFVLQWDEDPSDLDLHLIGPGFHISYQDMHNAPNKARLDRDARSGFGPETITLDRVDANGLYTVWVDNYSRSPSFKGYSRLYVYTGNGLDRVIRIPKTKQRAVKAVEIRQQNLNTINKPSIAVR